MTRSSAQRKSSAAKPSKNVHYRKKPSKLGVFVKSMDITSVQSSDATVHYDDGFFRRVWTSLLKSMLLSLEFML